MIGLILAFLVLCFLAACLAACAGWAAAYVAHNSSWPAVGYLTICAGLGLFIVGGAWLQNLPAALGFIAGVFLYCLFCPIGREA